ncbi:class I SAM-dependent DNA methyltransferase [Microbacterium sp. NPDC007973]|uniref:HsdM family class I SAM-dependent methyltransferase n=1 Tax=Microbacterium sp. NPDC007973 TaxID=3364182 RepID=UPI0036F054F9
MTFPANYQLPSFSPFAKGSTNRELDDSATTADFRAIANAFHSEFFAEHADTEVFAHVVKLLLAKIYDERQRRKGEPYVFQVLQRAGREETAQSLFARVATLYEAAYKAYIDSAGGDRLDSKLFAPERVKSVVKGLQGVAITRGAALHGDIIGAFFEEIVRAGFKQDKGMYFTHSNLVAFMLEAIDLTGLTQETWRGANHPNNRMPYLIDPSCGSGAFLLRAMQMMSSAIRDNRTALVETQDDQRYFDHHLSDSNPNEWAKDFVYGSDPKFVMAITTKVNMVLHGDGSAHIFKWDSLQSLGVAPDTRFAPAAEARRSVPPSAYREDVSEQFDVVVTNPPFGITLAPETHRTVSKTFSLGHASSEALFLERYAQLLRPNGRLGVVVPESLLNAAEHRETRMLLLRFFHVRAVVSLPRNLFVETPTLTSLLFAQKKTGAEIADWDARAETARKTVEDAIADAKRAAREAGKRANATAASVKDALDRALDGAIPGGAFIRKRGKNPTVLTYDLPPGMSDAAPAVKHYTEFLTSSGIGPLITQAVLARMAADLDYSWPVYGVEEVGYKLSKRGERTRPNQLISFVDGSGTHVANLHRADGAATTVIDADNPSTVIDYIRRDVTWR